MIPEEKRPAGTGRDNDDTDRLPDEDVRVVTLEEFTAVQELGTEPLLGEPAAILIPTNGDVMFYGDGGAGKTTLVIDLNLHLAAGDAWLGISVPSALNVLMIENEGPRSLFREKLRRKQQVWDGSPLSGRVHVLSDPWAKLTLADEGWRATLGLMIAQLELDMVTIGPVVCAGMSAAGTMQDTRAFQALLAEVRQLAGRSVTFNLIHHENKGGSVSGAWEGTGDTLVHVRGLGTGRTRVHVQKARWSSLHHGQTLELRWTDGEGFEVEDAPELDDPAIAEMILRVVQTHPGTGWSRVEEAVPGMSHQRRRAVRDAMLRAGTLINIAKIDGREVALDHCPERKQARLYLADDPTIAHLRPDPGAVEAQSAPARGERGQAQLRPAPQLCRGAGGAGADSPPAGRPGDPTLEV